MRTAVDETEFQIPEHYEQSEEILAEPNTTLFWSQAMFDDLPSGLPTDSKL